MTELGSKAEKKAHLQEHIQHTVANLHEAENYLDEHSGEISEGMKKVIEAKNKRREESINGFATKINHETKQ